MSTDTFQAACDEIDRLSTLNVELLAALRGMSHALNVARLVVADEASRDYMGELVRSADEIIANAEMPGGLRA
jgi:hypothetical protein